MLRERPTFRVSLLIKIFVMVAFACAASTLAPTTSGSPVPAHHPPSERTVHLVVCVNGFSGHAGEFDNLQRYLRQEHDRRVLSSSGDLHILLSRANEKTRTMHGLVVMGTRLAREVHAYVKDVLAVDVGRGRASSDVEFREEGDAVVGDGEQQVRDEHMTARLGDTAVDERDGTIEQRLTAGDAPTNKLTVHLTIIGHSLGGLIARYAVRLMLAADGGSALPEFDLQMALREGTQGYGVYDTVEVVPLSYISVGSPHLGSRRPRPQSPDTLRRVWATIMHGAAERGIVGRTGRELFLVDDYNADLRADATDQPPILQQMADPAGPFMRTLTRFRQRTAVAMVNDWDVPLCTAAIRSYHPLLEREMSKKVEEVQKERFTVRSLSGFNVHAKESMASWMQENLDAPTEANMPEVDDMTQRGTAHHEDEEFEGEQTLHPVRSRSSGKAKASPTSIPTSKQESTGFFMRLRTAVCGTYCFGPTKTIEGPEEVHTSAGDIELVVNAPVSTPIATPAASTDATTAATSFPSTSSPSTTTPSTTPPSTSTPRQLTTRHDNAALVEFDETMIRNLQHLQWRRVIFDFHLDFRHQFSVHQLAIGKHLEWPYLNPASNDVAKGAGSWIARLVVMDFMEVAGQQLGASH